MIRPIISTSRLTLRPLQAGDEADLLGLFGDDRFMRYAASAPWSDTADAQRLIERAARGLETLAEVRLAVVEDNVLVGTCSLLNVDRANRRAEVGYGVAVRHWGRGIARESVRAILHWGFHELALHRVEANVDPDNAPSIRVLESLGFQHEGTLRERLFVGTTAFSSSVYGLLERDWVANERRLEQVPT